MDYRIDYELKPYEQVYSCANLFKQRLYTVIIEHLSNTDVSVTVEVSFYPYQDLARDLTKISSGRYVFRKSKRLVEMSEKDISDIVKFIPWQLRQRAFEDVVPLFYLKNARVKSKKYMELVPNYKRAVEKLDDKLFLSVDLSQFTY